MQELIEVVLENISPEKIHPIIKDLLKKNENIIEIQCSEELDFLEKGKISGSDIMSFINLPDDACLYVKIRELKIDNVNIACVLLRLVKYGKQFDIDFNFDEKNTEDTGIKIFMEKMHGYTINLGEIYQIGHWFCGIEPASDKETRYFTDYEAGPLVLI